jgi:hypothetical protein
MSTVPPSIPVWLPVNAPEPTVDANGDRVVKLPDGTEYRHTPGAKTYTMTRQLPVDELITNVFETLMQAGFVCRDGYDLRYEDDTREITIKVRLR